MSPDPDTAGRSGIPWGRFLVVAVLALLDQASKSAVFAWLGPGAEGAERLVRDHHGHLRLPVLGEWLGLMLSYNPGAAFGRLSQFPHLLVLGRSAAVVFLVVFLARSPRRPFLVLCAIVLVLAGALGNLTDNLLTGGIEPGHPYRAVRDFIDVWFLNEGWGWDWHFHTFNVADSCITIGAVLWVASGLFQRPATGRVSGAAAGEGAGGSGPADGG